MRCALDGFPSMLPAPIRLLAKLFWKKKALAGGKMRGGSPTAPFLVPNESLGFDEGMAMLREQVARVEAGERFTHPSALFGELTHDEWVVLQLGHIRHHLSFLHPE